MAAGFSKKICNFKKKQNKKQTLWPLFMDGVQLPQGWSHFEEAVWAGILQNTTEQLLLYFQLSNRD